MAKNGTIFLNLLNLAPKKIHDIIESLDDPDQIFRITSYDLNKIASLNQKNIDEIIHLRKSNILDKELELIEKANISVIDIFDRSYPALLNEISYPPIVLYLKGSETILSENLFAIVGSRIPTLYGISTAAKFSYQLSAAGLTIVSGLAKGIDTIAHKEAIRTGKSIAVLGSGLLNTYPKENAQLAEKISLNGAVISEFPLKTAPLRENFPRRNRIVSGLSYGVLVVEAATRSGALITARLACEQNREVFAIPGNVDSPLSRGTHRLIKEGATLVDSIDDILNELNIPYQQQTISYDANLNPDEKIILDMIHNEGAYLEELLIKSNTNPAMINKIILNLQLKGLIKEIKPSCFIKNTYLH